MRRPLVSRGTKPFRSGTNGFGGGFPRDFLPWVHNEGWLTETSKVCWLCAGGVTEPGFKIDIRPETKPDLVADASATGLDGDLFEVTVIDPPYTRDLARDLYNTADHFHSINVFVDEAVRITKPGGNIITLSYEPPKIPADCYLLAVWGVYTIPLPNFIRCFCVFRKQEAV